MIACADPPVLPRVTLRQPHILLLWERIDRNLSSAPVGTENLPTAEISNSD